MKYKRLLHFAMLFPKITGIPPAEIDSHRLKLPKIGLRFLTTVLFALALILPAGVITALPTNIAAATSSEIATPGNLTAILVSDYEVGLTWEDNSTNESGFHIVTATNIDFTGSLVFTIPANITSYSDKTVAPTGDTYYYKITAFTNSGDESAPSNTASITINVPKIGVPNAPGNLSAIPSGPGQISLTWADNSTNETGFQLERAVDSDFNVGVVSVMVAANTTTFMDTTAAAGKLYYYRIFANNALGLSVPSDTIRVTANASIQVPSPPTNLAARPLGPTQVRLSWSTAETDQTEFNVERATDATFNAGLTRFVLPADVAEYMITFMDDTAVAGITYYYRVFAVNSLGLSSPSTVASATTPMSTNAPSNSATTESQRTDILFGSIVVPMPLKYGLIAIVLVAVSLVLLVSKRRRD